MNMKRERRGRGYRVYRKRMCKYAAFLVLAFIASFGQSFHTARISVLSTRNGRLYSPQPLFALPFPFKKKSDKPEKKSDKPKHGKDVVLHIESIEDYKKLVVDEKESITVVRFYAHYCRSCRASEPLFYKLAMDFHDHGVNGGGVKFAEVPLNPKTKLLHDALEVPSLPWTHIYHPDAGLVEERKISKKHIDDVRKCLRCYVYGECDIDDAPAGCITLYGECDIDDGPPDGSWE